MLDLLSAGLVSGWLKMAGLPTSLDPWELVNRSEIWQSGDPVAERTVNQYLKLLSSQGLDTSKQGIWLQSGSTVLTNNRGMTAIPAASLTKIATSLASLQTWGTNHQFETLISATGPIQNGVLQGDLVVQGDGDPLFEFEDAIALGNALNKLGITRVSGDLIVTGRFMLSFRDEVNKSGELLKKALNSKSWDDDIREEFGALPEARPIVEIKGKVRIGAALPQQILLVRHRSLPLVQLIRYLNVYSQNEMAQLLADNLGGAQVVMQKATTAARLAPNELQLINGSGLGTENRISPHAACAMFAAIERSIHPLNLTIADLFPTAGFDRRGTLEDRSVPARSVVKTGTLNEVSALSGVLPTRDRGFVWFAIINHGSDISQLRQQQDQLLQALQREWGTTDAPMIQPSAWLVEQRSRLTPEARTEIVAKTE